MPYIPNNAGTIIFSCAIPAATQQGLTVNHYYWLNNDNTVTDGGTVTANITGLTPKGLIDCSGFDYVKVNIVVGAETGSAGGVLGLMDLWPPPIFPPSGFTIPAGAITNTMQWFWSLSAAATSAFSTVISPNIAQTQSAGSVAVTNQITVGGKPGMCGLTLFFTTAPTTAQTLNVVVQGY